MSKMRRAFLAQNNTRTAADFREMKLFKNNFRVAILTGIILLLLAGCLYGWAITAFEMRFLSCNGTFRLDSIEWVCRQPAILVYAAAFVFIGSVATFGVALFLRLRKKPTS